MSPQDPRPVSRRNPTRTAHHGTSHLDTTDRSLIAKAAGDVHEVLALRLGETEYTLAITEPGMEADPPAPYAPAAWLQLLADRLP